MKDYELALGNNVETLEAEIERFVGLGYICQGGIAISESYGRMAQAMVLKSGPLGIATPVPAPEPATVKRKPSGS